MSVVGAPMVWCALLVMAGMVALACWMLIKLWRWFASGKITHGGRMPIEACLALFAALIVCMALMGCATQRDFNHHKMIDAAVTDAQTQSLIQIIDLVQDLDRRVNRLEQQPLDRERRRPAKMKGLPPYTFEPSYNGDPVEGRPL
jgi:hypothetical protein